jgi:hypothetical protein
MPQANNAGLRNKLLMPAFCWLLPVCVAVLVSTLTANALRTTNVAGTYQGRAGTKDPSKRLFTLNLIAGGAAIFTTLYIGKEEATQHGGWVQTGNQIVLTFDALGSNQPLRPITFRHRYHELSPIHWDVGEWGRSGPPVLHLARSNFTGG